MADSSHWSGSAFRLPLVAVRSGSGARSSAASFSACRIDGASASSSSIEAN
jgi:hypothetical protein